MLMRAKLARFGPGARGREAKDGEGNEGAAHRDLHVFRYNVTVRNRRRMSSAFGIAAAISAAMRGIREDQPSEVSTAFATPTKAGRNRRPEMVKPACITSITVFGSAPGIGASNIA